MTARRSKARRAFARQAPVNWRAFAGVVRHVFTHFPLELTVYAAASAGARAGAGGYALGRA